MSSLKYDHSDQSCRIYAYVKKNGKNAQRHFNELCAGYVGIRASLKTPGSHSVKHVVLPCGHKHVKKIVKDIKSELEAKFWEFYDVFNLLLTFLRRWLFHYSYTDVPCDCSFRVVSCLMLYCSV